MLPFQDATPTPAGDWRHIVERAARHGITLTDYLIELANGLQAQVLPLEVDARWDRDRLSRVGHLDAVAAPAAAPVAVFRGAPRIELQLRSAPSNRENHIAGISG
jgi:hypothetical protein